MTFSLVVEVGEAQAQAKKQARPDRPMQNV